MMRSLYSGVSGLQAHQIALDVEGNNIANVNTFGFKGSRANFSDMINQNVRIATGPRGNIGGTNPEQIGLGVGISSTTKMFSQGSIETTQKKTDMAIEGDGFFVISGDGGRSYKFTRNGDFIIDSAGNFVDSNGYIAQGWMADLKTGQVDPSMPTGNINIRPDITYPSKATSFLKLKATLNSGDFIGEHKSPIYPLDSRAGFYDNIKDGIKTDQNEHLENDVGDDLFDINGNIIERGIDAGVLFNGAGEAINLRKGQGVWVSYRDARTRPVEVDIPAGQPKRLDIDINGVQIYAKAISSINELISEINLKTSQTGVEAQLVNGNQIELVNSNSRGTEDTMKNIKLVSNGTNEITELETQNIITAYQYTYNNMPIATSHEYDDSVVREFHTTEDLREAMQQDARIYTNYTGEKIDATNIWDVINTAGTNPAAENNKNDGVEITVDDAGKFVIKNPKGDAFNEDDGDRFKQGTRYVDSYTLKKGKTYPANIFKNDSTGTLTIPKEVIDPNPGADVTVAPGATFPAADMKIADNFKITLGTNGKLEVTRDVLNTRENDKDMFINVTGLTNTKLNPNNPVAENEKFKILMGGFTGALNPGEATKSSLPVYVSTLGAGMEVYDSLGSKHTLHMKFTKTGVTDDGGTEWSVVISVPEPGVINPSGEGPKNIITGNLRFGNDGSLSSYSPTSLTYTANNGSAPNQNIELQFGKSTGFDGITSYDNESQIINKEQDGYAGGELRDINIDSSGTIVGAFTNGRSRALAQIALAKFTNNTGLQAEGGNIFTQTSNSGVAVIGTAGTGGRGGIKSSSIEMSNVDLSHSLTQLIVIQRGYQANSKTITTSDQLLNTLLQLKQ